MGRGRIHVDAEPLLMKGYEGMKDRKAKIPAMYKDRLIAGVERLVKLNEATGNSNEAAKWREELETFKLP